MPKFNYQAITETGTTTKGDIDADSVDSASSLLAGRGLIPTQVTVARRGAQAATATPGFSGLFSPVKTPELILFTKQFKTLIRSGVPMLTILQVLEDQTEHKRLKSILGQIHQDIREGASLYDGFRRHPNVFSPFTAACCGRANPPGPCPRFSIGSSM